MIYKKLILALLLFPTLIHAQKVLIFSSKLEKIDSANWGYNIDKVIDARSAITKNYLGRVQTGVFNSKNDAVLEKSLASELDKVIKSILPEVEDSMHLILKINRLKIWEQTFLATEEAYAFADFELILKRDTNYYLIDKHNGFIRKRSGWDVTGSHLPNIVLILKESLNAFQKNQSWLKSDTTFQKLSIQDCLNKNVPQITMDSVKQKGIYKHFGEFLDNNPKMPLAFTKVDGEKVLMVTDESGQRVALSRPDDVWGFCDGKDVFVGQSGNFFPIKFTNGKAQFKGYDVQKQVKRQQTGAVLFGIIGAAVASASQGSKEWLEIDMDSGQTFPSKEEKK